MITKNDCYLLLSELEINGVDTSVPIKELMSSPSPTLDVIKFINDNRQLGLTNFYEKLRKNYNNKKSKLYINIMKEIEQPQDVLITLSSLLTQILLFSKDVEDRQMFLRHSRANEITKVLSMYFRDFDLTNCVKLIKLIKVDIKALESIK
jgi:hypothetical protein